MASQRTKIEFITEFAGKPKGFVGEYSKNNADYLLSNKIGVVYTEPTEKKEEPKQPKPKSTKK